MRTFFRFACVALCLCFMFTASTVKAEVFVSSPDDESTDEDTQVFIPQKKQKKPEEVQDPNAYELNKIILLHAEEVGGYCVESWQTQRCMKALGSSNMTLVSLYAEKLKSNGHEDSLEILREECAASAAAVKIDVQAYAMKSAMTACANTIFDLTESTGIKPDLTHYQIMIESLFCLDGDPRCKAFETLLRDIVIKSMKLQEQQGAQ